MKLGTNDGFPANLFFCQTERSMTAPVDLARRLDISGEYPAKSMREELSIRAVAVLQMKGGGHSRFPEQRSAELKNGARKTLSIGNSAQCLIRHVETLRKQNVQLNGFTNDFT